MQLHYPYVVFQSDDGAWQVRFRDVPEALTEGDTEAEAHALAPDALRAALEGLAKLRRDLPEPNVSGKFFVAISVTARGTRALLGDA